MFQLGIIGGMGPRASNAILDDIYRRFAYFAEQDMPDVLMLSTPSMPDRSGAAGLASALQHAVEIAETARVKNLIIACYSAHAHFDSLRFKSAIFYNILSASLDTLNADSEKTLILCRSHLALFLQNKGITGELPSPKLQAAIDKLIVAYKNYENTDTLVHYICNKLAEREFCHVYLLCTELAALYKKFSVHQRNFNVKSPLHGIIADALGLTSA